MTEAIKAIEATAAPSGSGHFGVAVAAATGVSDAAPRMAVAVPEDPQATRALLEEAAQALGPTAVELSYSIDPDLKRVVVEVRDRVDGTVLRRIPSEELLQLARRLKEGLGGLFETKA